MAKRKIDALKKEREKARAKRGWQIAMYDRKERCLDIWPEALALINDLIYRSRESPDLVVFGVWTNPKRA